MTAATEMTDTTLHRTPAVAFAFRYFGVEEEDTNVVPAVAPNAQQFGFGTQGQMPQQGGFNFGGPMG